MKVLFRVNGKMESNMEPVCIQITMESPNRENGLKENVLSGSNDF